MARAATLPSNIDIGSLYRSGMHLVDLARFLHAHTRRVRKLLISSGVNIRPQGQSNKGRHHSMETKLHLSNMLKGRHMSSEFCRHQSLTKKGHLVTEITRQKISISAKRRTGFLNGNWRGGVTTPNEKIRKSDKYKVWRKDVMVRDHYTCQSCGQLGRKLHADHIKPFSSFPELRFDIDNGRTLCKDCHLATPTYAGKLQQKGGIVCVQS